MTPSRKTEIGPVDGTPVKRLFWSIISDYDLSTGLCELIDNALDMWLLSGKRKPLDIDVQLDGIQQRIRVQDNAGGVKHDELHLLITPGGSRNDPYAHVIGIFGVGGKRAGIALGEHVEIKTRHGAQESYQLDITNDWLDTEDWELPIYAIPNIAPRTTAVEISRLRQPLLEDDVERIKHHLSETYASFLGDSCSITVNGTSLAGHRFTAWAYPKHYPPREIRTVVKLGKEMVKITITAGLITDRNPEHENYGVYVYCNDRLIVKELRSRDVGYFVTTEAGVPHADASLCRAIVSITGPARMMPWNSSKSGITPSHPLFQRIRQPLIQLVSYFSSLSRRLKHDWDTQVFAHPTGTIERTDIDIAPGDRLRLPDLPRVRRSHVEHLKERNKRTLKDSPWTLGLIEALAAADVIARQRFQTKNRIALILLDSNFEIALKEVIVHRTDLFPKSSFTDAKIQQLFRNRSDVVAAVTAAIPIPPRLLARASHYYGLRNKLIHERATVDITDDDVENYRATVGHVLKLLFGLKPVD